MPQHRRTSYAGNLTGLSRRVAIAQYTIALMAEGKSLDWCAEHLGLAPGTLQVYIGQWRTEMARRYGQP